MSEALTTAAEQIELSQALQIGGTSADRTFVRFIVLPMNPTISQSEERVRKAKTSHRGALILGFAERAHALPYLRELWLDDDGEEAVAHAIVEGASLDQELELEAVFTAATADAPFDGYLLIHAVEDNRVDSARSGRRVYPE